ncbi:MAG: hypothetical protein WBV35_19535, partial [Steroidobacteraceae bacterium]
GRLQRSGAVTDFTGAKVTFRLCAEDTRQLFEAVSQYEFATDVRVTGDAVYLDLIDEAPARLNRHLAARGIYLKELSSQRQTLEEAFLAVTAAKATARAGEEA